MSEEGKLHAWLQGTHTDLTRVCTGVWQWVMCGSAWPSPMITHTHLHTYTTPNTHNNQTVTAMLLHCNHDLVANNHAPLLGAAVAQDQENRLTASLS